MYSMSVLVTLPEVLSSSLLSNWLTIVDAAHLDSAFCSTYHRGEFLRTAYKSAVCLQYPAEKMKESMWDSVNTWIFKRGVPVSGFYASSLFLRSAKREEYLKQHGDSVRWVEYAPRFNTNYMPPQYRLSALEIVQYCPQLTSFDAANCHDETVLKTVIQSCPLLEDIVIRQNGCTQEVVRELTTRCTRLRQVTLTSEELGSECLVPLVRNSPGLVTFRLHGRDTSRGRACWFSLIDELAAGCHGMKDFSITYTDLSLDTFYILLHQWPNLACLCFQHSDFFSPGDSDEESENQDDESEGEELPPRAGGEELHSTAAYRARRQCPPVLPSLRTLRLVNVELMCEDLDKLLRTCPNLTSLEVQKCTQFTDFHLLPVGTRCPQLQKLTIFENFDAPGDEFLTDLVAHCVDLREVILPGSVYFTAASLCDMARRCPLLEVVNFSDCSGVSDAFLAELAQRCGGLKVLLLFCCAGITDAGVAAVMQGCRRLVEFGVEGCSGITSKKRQVVTRRYPKTRDVGSYIGPLEWS